MSMSKFPRISAHIFLILLLLARVNLAPSRAYAATASSPFTVSATVLSLCLIVATDMAFGNYNSSAGSPLTATSTVVVTCTLGTSYTVSMTAGNGTGATVAARSMTNGTSNLNYLLYTNSGRTTLWGDGTLSTSTVGGTAVLLPATYTVYGSIPTGQFASPGIYGDIVTATVTY